MKKFNVIMLFLIGLSLSSFISKKNENDLIKNGIKGNVKKIHETTYIGIEKFGEFQKQSTKSSSVSIYNTLGNLATKISYTIDGSLKDSTNYKYDSNNNCKESNSFKSNGVLSGKTISKYNQDNRVIEINFYEPDGSLHFKFVKKYDVNGNNIESLEYNSEGNLESRAFGVFDVNGKLVELGFVIERKSYKAIYKYDSKNNLIEVQKYWDSTLDEKLTYKYDENSNLIEESSIDSEGNLSPVISNKYDYDNKGNWIKKNIFKNSIQVELTERVIEYY